MFYCFPGIRFMRFNCDTNAFVRIMDILNKAFVVFHFYCVIYGFPARSLEEKLRGHLLQTTNSTARNSTTDNVMYTMEEILATCSIKNVTIRTACIAALVGRTNSDISDVDPDVKPATMFDSTPTISVYGLSNHTTLSKIDRIGSNENQLGMLIKTNTSMITGSNDKTQVEETLKTTLPASNVFNDRINQDGLSTMQNGLPLVIPKSKNENYSVNVNSRTETTTQTSLVQPDTFVNTAARDSLSSAVLIAPGLPKNAKKVSTIIEDYVTSLGRPVENHAAANDLLEEQVGLPLATTNTSEVAILGVAGSMMCALCRQQMDITCIARWCINTNMQSDFGAVV